jgi:hypothetical protein
VITDNGVMEVLIVIKRIIKDAFKMSGTLKRGDN